MHAVSWMIRSADPGRAFLTSASVSFALVAFALVDGGAAGSADTSVARGASLLPEVASGDVMPVHQEAVGHGRILDQLHPM